MPRSATSTQQKQQKTQTKETKTKRIIIDRYSIHPFHPKPSPEVATAAVDSNANRSNFMGNGRNGVNGSHNNSQINNGTVGGWVGGGGG